MKGRERNIFQKNYTYKVIVGIMIGLAMSSIGVYAATSIAGSNITYSNTESGLSSTNVQGAIDELYEQLDIRKAGKFVAAYTYNETGANKCITGEESTCQRTTCYKNKTAGSCPSGTIIKYKVNDTDIVNFHVMFDNGSTMIMQSQKTTIYNTPWYESSNDNTKGPTTILPILEKATAGWSNVNDQTYTLGTTNFSGKGAYTGCSAYNSCTTNKYTLPSRTAKARMITLQEAVALGCTSTARSCPIWMYNYLYNSTGSGGTVNDKVGGSNYAYWTMSAYLSNSVFAWAVSYIGRPTTSNFDNTSYTYNGARAVVEVSK